MRVLLAIASPLTRALAERALQQIPIIDVVGTPHDAAQAAALMQTVKHDLVLVEGGLYADLASHLADMHRRPSGSSRLVLLVARSQSTAVDLPPGVSAILPIDLPPAELGSYLDTLVDVRAEAPRADAPPPQAAKQPERQIISTSQPPADRAQSWWQPTTSGTAAPATREQRKIADRERALFRQVTTMPPGHPSRDPGTSLLTREALASATRAVQEMQYPVAVVVCACTFAPGSVVPTDLTTYNEVLRRIERALRLAVREYDLVSHVGSMAFAVLLPGCPRSDAAPVGDRLVRSLVTLQLTQLSYGTQLQVAIGIGAWEPGERVVDPLDSALAALGTARR